MEASLAWTISKRRRKEGGFLGSSVIIPQLTGGVTRRRVGLIVKGAPARSGTRITVDDKEIGVITSGCPSPSLGVNVAMAHVASGNHKIGTNVKVLVRNKAQEATVTKMPFVPHQYYRPS